MLQSLKKSPGQGMWVVNELLCGNHWYDRDTQALPTLDELVPSHGRQILLHQLIDFISPVPTHDSVGPFWVRKNRMVHYVFGKAVEMTAIEHG